MTDTITPITWVRDDGGYSKAGFRAKHGNEVIIALAIATGAGYRKVYDDLYRRQIDFVRRSRSRRIKDKGAAISEVGIWPQVSKAYLDELRWTWTPTMSIGSGTTVHMNFEELPDEPVMLLSISRSMAAIQHGILYGTHDMSRNGSRAVYGYWVPPRF